MKKVFYPTKGRRIASQPGLPGQTTQPAPQPGMPNRPVPRRGGKGQALGDALKKRREQLMGTGGQPFNQNQPPLV